MRMFLEIYCTPCVLLFVYVKLIIVSVYFINIYDMYLTDLSSYDWIAFGAQARLGGPNVARADCGKRAVR